MSTRPAIKPDGTTAGQTLGSVWTDASGSWAWNGVTVTDTVNGDGDGTQIVVQHPTFLNYYFNDRPAPPVETFTAEEAIQVRGTFASVADAVAAQDPTQGTHQSDIVIIPINGVPTPHRAEGGTYVIDDTKSTVQTAPADGFTLTEAQWNANVTVPLDDGGNIQFHLPDKSTTYAAYVAKATFADRHRPVGVSANTQNFQLEQDALDTITVASQGLADLTTIKQGQSIIVGLAAGFIGKWENISGSDKFATENALADPTCFRKQSASKPDHEITRSNGEALLSGDGIVNRLNNNGIFLPPADIAVDEIIYFSLVGGASAIVDTIPVVSNSGTDKKIYAYVLTSDNPTNVWAPYNQGASNNAIDNAAALDVTKPLTPTDLISYTFPAAPDAGGDWVSADGVTFTVDQEVFLKPVANIAADALSDPLTIADVLLFNNFKESSAEGLRGNPVATIGDLTALIARDDEHRKVLGGPSYVFELGGTVVDASDVAHTTPAGVWRVDRFFGEVASDRIGSVIQMSPLDEFGVVITDDGWLAKGIFPWTSGYRAVGAALANPKFSAMHPYLVDGNDLVGPANADGSIFRNLGDLAAAFGVWQDHKTGLPTQTNFSTNNDTHNHTFTAYGGAFANSGAHQHTLAQQYNSGGQRATTSDTHSHSINGGGDDETIAANYAVKYGLILDSYSSRLLVESIAATVSTALADNGPDRVYNAPVVSAELTRIEAKIDAKGGQYVNSVASRTLLAALTTLPNSPGGTEPITEGDFGYTTTDEVGTGTVLLPEFPAGRYVYDATIAPIFESPSTVYVDRIPVLGQVASQLAYPADGPNANGLTIKHQAAGALRKYLYEPADPNGDGSAFVVSAAFDPLQWQRVGVAELEAQDLNILHLAGTVVATTDTKATAWSMTFLDIVSGTAAFPAGADGDAIQIDAGGQAVFDTGDGSGAIGRAVAAGEIYELTNGVWAKRVNAASSAKRFKDLWEAYTISGASVAGTDDLTFTSVQGTVPARFDMGAGGAADEINYDLGVNNYLGNVLIKKQPNVVMMKLTWPGGSAVNLFVHPTGKVQQMAGSNASIQIGGVAIADATGVIDEAHANNIVISDTPSGAEWIIGLTADASAGDVSNLSIGFSTFAAGGGPVAGPLELAFDIHSLVGNHVEPIRNDVTINGTLYTADPGGILGHQGATAISPTRYFITLPPSMEIDTVTIDSGGGSFYQPANISNAIDVTGAGAPQVITVTFRLATATLLESRVMIVASPDETSVIAGPETLTIPSAKTVGDLLNEYDELIFTAQETALNDYAYSASVITSEYRVNIANGDTRIALATTFSAVARQFYIDNVEETDTELVLNKSAGNGHKNFKVWGIKKLAVDPATVIVPAPDVNIAAVGGLNTINGAATFPVPQGQPVSIQLDMAAGQQIDTATLPAIDGTGATLKVIDVIAGTVTVVAAADSTAITFATKASAIAETMNFVGSFDLGNTNINVAAVWDTGLDFTIPDSEIRIKQSSNRSDNLYSHYSQPVPVRIFNHSEGMKSAFFTNAATNYINLEIESAADAAIGRIRLDANTICYAQTLELWTRSPRAFAVPTAAIASNIVVINANAVATKGECREGQTCEVKATLTPGFHVDLDLPITVDGAGGWAVCSHREGLFRVKIPVGAGGPRNITFTEKAAPLNDRTRTHPNSTALTNNTGGGYNKVPGLDLVVDRTGKAEFRFAGTTNNYGPSNNSTYRLVVERASNGNVPEVLDRHTQYLNKINYYLKSRTFLSSDILDVTIGDRYYIDYLATDQIIHQFDSTVSTYLDYTRLS